MIVMTMHNVCAEVDGLVFDALHVVSSCQYRTVSLSTHIKETCKWNALKLMAVTCDMHRERHKDANTDRQTNELRRKLYMQRQQTHKLIMAKAGCIIIDERDNIKHCMFIIGWYILIYLHILIEHLFTHIYIHTLYINAYIYRWRLLFSIMLVRVVLILQNMIWKWGFCFYWCKKSDKNLKRIGQYLQVVIPHERFWALICPPINNCGCLCILFYLK